MDSCRIHSDHRSVHQCHLALWTHSLESDLCRFLVFDWSLPLVTWNCLDHLCFLFLLTWFLFQWYQFNPFLATVSSIGTCLIHGILDSHDTHLVLFCISFNTCWNVFLHRNLHFCPSSCLRIHSWIHFYHFGWVTIFGDSKAVPSTTQWNQEEEEGGGGGGGSGGKKLSSISARDHKGHWWREPEFRDSLILENSLILKIVWLKFLILLASNYSQNFFNTHNLDSFSINSFSINASLINRLIINTFEEIKIKLVDWLILSWLHLTHNDDHSHSFVFFWLHCYAFEGTSFVGQEMVIQQLLYKWIQEGRSKRREKSIHKDR